MFGVVGIDMIAGPSEVVVLADASADPAFVAADLLGQAEHDEAAQSILITDDARLGRLVAEEVTPSSSPTCRAKRSPPRAGATTARSSWSKSRRRRAAGRPARARASGDHRRGRRGAVAQAIHNAGAIFLGPHTPEAIGDYVGGSNHVLPTSRSARFSSGLGVHDFVKRTSILACDAAALKALGPAAVTLGEAEGLDAHARSVAMRLERLT